MFSENIKKKITAQLYIHLSTTQKTPPKFTQREHQNHLLSLWY